MSEIEQLQEAIAALEKQRIVLGDAVVDAALGPMRQKLSALQVSETPANQRKLVTVLFADLSGFTALSERMDAEDVQSMVNAVWQTVDRVIAEHGGKIDKHIGDAVMALWGADEAREDDPERAIRAALSMQDAIRDFAGRNMDTPIQMRVGINTGLALLGEVGTVGEITALGDSVNVSARLEKAAPIGGVLISHDTYRHVRGIFDVSEQPPLGVKGKAEPLQAYVVERAKPRAFRLFTRGVEGVETRMIGREAELKHLQDSYIIAAEDRTGQVVTIVGEAGLGKSRLLYEFENWIELRPEQIWVFQARATQQSEHIPYSLMRDLFSYRFEIQDNDPVSVARQKFVNGVSGFLGANNTEERAHFIGQLMGVDFSDSPALAGILNDSSQIRDRAFHYAAELFKAAANSKPTVMLLEDIHWADDGSLDLIAHIAQECRSLPLLILCLTRPILFERRPLWGSGQTFHTRLNLNPLSRLDSRRLADEILKKMLDIPSVLREMLTGNAEGNPFYMEELVKMLIDDGVIMTGANEWRIDPGKLLEVKVPPTLTGVLQARLDSLPPEEKRTLQRASIVGRVFWDTAVSQLGSNGHTTPALSGLAARELIFLRETSAFAGAQEYIFKHNILYEITYETVLKRERRLYHAQIARWLIAQSQERVEEFAGQIAYHYELADENVEAAQYLQRAAERALRTSAFREAMTHAERALNLIPTSGTESQAAALHNIVAEAGLGMSDFAIAQTALEKAIENANRVGDQKQYSTALASLGDVAARRGDFAAAVRSLHEALDLARAGKDQEAMANSLAHLSRILFQQGQYDELKTSAEEALSLYSMLGSTQGMAHAHHMLGFAAMSATLPHEGRRHFEQALELARQSGDRRRESQMLANLGEVARQHGETADARAYFEEAQRAFIELGSRENLVITMLNLGLMERDAGAWSQAFDSFRKALREAHAIGYVVLVNHTLAAIATILAQQGEEDRALALAGYVLASPATDEEVRAELTPMLAALEEKLVKDQIEAGLRLGASLNLEDTIEELLVGTE